MKKVVSISKSIVLLVILSVVYAALEMNIIFLLPIITIALPFKFMSYKDDNKSRENKRILSNLYIFNIISFAIAIVATKQMNSLIFDLIFNIILCFIYYKLMTLIENKRDAVFRNPQAVYDKINKKIEVLESLYAQTEEGLNNTSDEKSKTVIEAKLTAIKIKIDDLKRQLEVIKTQVEINKQQGNLK